MKLFGLATLIAIASAHFAVEAPTATEVLTKYVFTCPCDASRSVSIGTTYVQSGLAEASWYGWEGGEPHSTAKSSKGQGYSSSTLRSSPSYSTTSSSSTISTSSSSVSTSTGTITSTTSSTGTTSSVSTSQTTATTTSSSFIIVATTSPAARLMKRATLYLAFNATGYSYLTGSQLTAQGLTNDVNGNLITTGFPFQYVGFSNSDPQYLQLFSSLPSSPVKVTISSTGSLTINNVASQCDDNSAGNAGFVVVQNGGATSTPTGCTPVTLGSASYVAVTYSSTCTTTTSVRPITSCTTYQISGSSTIGTTICSSSTSSSVFGTTTLMAVANGCSTVQATPTG